VALVAVGAVGAGAAIAVASVSDTNGVIHACVNTLAGGGTANVRVIDTGAGQQCDPANGETTLSWNITGPQGQTGPQGLPGANGRSATITAGNTITIGGSVITVGQSRGITIAAPSISGNRIGTMTLSGGLSLTTPILGVSFAIQQAGSGRGTGKNSIHDLTVTRKLDKSSAKLSLACANGTHIKEVVINVGKAGKEIDYDLKEVLIASYAVSSSKSQLIETMTLNFTSETIKVHK
jgi:hypothetical protein